MRGLVLVLVVPCALGAMLLTSPQFKNFDDIPDQFACDPQYPDHLAGSSPPLEWFRPPEKTRSYMLMVDDMSTEEGGFVQWLVVDIPVSTTSLETDASRFGMPIGSKELQASTGEYGYSSLCPVGETHTYRFRLYAMRTATTTLNIEGPVTTSVVQAALTALGDDVIYVATMVGKLYLEPPVEVVTLPPPPVIVPVTTVDPIPTRRYLKPSESLYQKRPHYNPRPVVNTTTDSICARFRDGNHSTLYAQLCKEDMVQSELHNRVLQMVEGGGEEQPSRQAAAVTAQSVAHTLIAAQAAPAPAPAPHTPPHAPTRPHSDPVVLESVDVEESMKQFSGEMEGLIDWDCEGTGGANGIQDLELRSPVIDACVNRDQGFSVLPSQFSCDPSDPSLSRTSPPLVWRMSDEGNKTKCETLSYVVMLEDIKSQKVNWLITDIPPSVNILGLGASGDPMVNLGTEEINSYRTVSYYPPCFDVSGPRAFRFHLYARPTRSTKLTSTVVTSASSLINAQMADSCHSATLDFAVAPPS